MKVTPPNSNFKKIPGVRVALILAVVGYCKHISPGL